MVTEIATKVIDADAHVVETTRTWDYIEPSDQKFRPVLYQANDGTIAWKVGDLIRPTSFNLNKQQLSELSKKQANTPNIAFEKLNQADPCGERPQAPPTYNNPQYKKSQEYKVYYKKLRIWRNCTGN